MATEPEDDESDPNNWKGTGLPREKVREAWEAMPKDTRPGWSAFVKSKREAHDRSKQKQEFEKVLDGFVGIKLTLPVNMVEVWVEASKSVAVPVRVMDATKPAHKLVVYRLTPTDRDKLKPVWDEWSKLQLAPTTPST